MAIDKSTDNPPVQKREICLNLLSFMKREGYNEMTIETAFMEPRNYILDYQ